MIPTLLSEWSLDAIRGLLAAGIHESEEFDLKQQLPDSRDDAGKRRLREACCAFANSGGGFLVFGVADDRDRSPADRLVGLPRSTDFPEHFGNFPKSCSPSVHWTFLNPPLALGADTVIHVVHVPQSWRAPHATGSMESGWRFTKRTNKGSEGMSVEEVRATYQGFYEKRLGLQLLASELAALEETARGAVIDDKNIETSYSLVTLELQTIESIVSNTYALTANHPQLITTLLTLRRVAVVLNNKARVYYTTANLAFSNKNRMIRDHNEFMNQRFHRIGTLASEARVLLMPLLAA